VHVAEATPARVETRTSSIALVSSLAELPRVAAAPAPASPAAVATTAPPSPAESPSHALPIAILSIGGAAVTTGAAYGVLALRENARFNHAAAISDRTALQATTKKDARFADAFAIGGIVAAGFGLALW
jgi:hypothetical protein